MKREIKFRIFDPAQKLFIHPSKFSFNADFSQKFFRGDLKLVKESHSEKCIINQFTGLLDKNGVEIYEDDIVDYRCQSNPKKSDIRTIKFEDGFYIAAGFYSINLWSLHNSVTIIGNIHENPELLKK